jgi:hypothetical protein
MVISYPNVPVATPGIVPEAEITGAIVSHWLPISFALNPRYHEGKGLSRMASKLLSRSKLLLLR